MKVGEHDGNGRDFSEENAVTLLRKAKVGPVHIPPSPQLG